MRTIMIIIGTRPEAIKMAPVIRALQKQDKVFRVLTCATAQHRELLDQVIAAFGLQVDIDLNLMSPGQSLADVTSRVLQGVHAVLGEHKPNAVLVHGDTTTAFSASLAAYYLKIPVGHVEAGLRTHDPYHPFPEEINRRLCGQLARFHFAPTPRAKNNLLLENIAEKDIIVTGNTVIDALYSIVREEYVFPEEHLEGLGRNRKLILVTVHRRENFGAPMESLCHALKDIALANDNVEIAVTVHPNPNVKQMLHRALEHTERIYLLPPLDYVPFVQLMKKATLILSDSGGIQEEAPALDIPLLILRNHTERPESVEAGAAKLVGMNREIIGAAVQGLLENKAEYGAMASAVNPFGDGNASGRIVDHLLSVLDED